MDFSTLETGSPILVILKSFERFVGEFMTYKEESATITLKNVRFLYDEDQTSEKSSLKSGVTFGEILVECQQIQHVEVMVHEPSPPTSNIAHLNSMTAVENSASFFAGSPLFPMNSSFQVSNLSWFPGRKPLHILHQGDLQKQLQESMQDYCKKLFENSNFARLIPPVAIPQDKNLDIGLPYYFVKFYREPTTPVGNEVMRNTSQQCQKLVTVQQNFNELIQKPKTNPQGHMQLDNCVAQTACASDVSKFPNNPDGNKGNQITLEHQLKDKIDLCDVAKSENLLPKLQDPSESQTPQFIRYSNGTLYLNETFLKSLYQQPGEQNSTTSNASLCVEDPSGFAMDCHAIE